MSDSKSLIFVISANIESLNKGLRDAERNFKRSFGNIEKTVNDFGNKTALISAGIVASLGFVVAKFSQIGEEIKNALPEDVEALKNFGIEIDPALLTASDELAAKIKQVKLAVDVFFAKLGEQVNIQGFLDKMIELTKSAIDFIDEHPGLIDALKKIGVGFIVLTGILKTFSLMMAAAKAFSGPAGWAQLAIGAVVLGGTFAALTALENANKTPEMFNGQDVSGFSAKTKELMGVPGYALGGIVTSPTLAMVGEAGPEAIIPLSGMGGGAQIITNHFHISGFIQDEMTLRAATQEISRILKEEDRRSRYTPNKTEYYSPSGHL